MTRGIMGIAADTGSGEVDSCTGREGTIRWEGPGWWIRNKDASTSGR